MNRTDIEREISEISARKAYDRRIPVPEDTAYCGIVRAINSLLSEAENHDKLLRERLDDLVDARDDAQTSNLLLKRVKDELRARSVQLDSALQKAAAASSSKSMFLANMSHEIRTPMNGILGMAELLNRSELNPKQRQQVSTIVHSGRALLTIINDILDFSKIESGRYELDPMPFDLKMCLGDIVELLTPTAKRKSLQIALEYGSGLPRHFVGDAGRIRQVVMNLAGNAVKFTDAGSVKIRASGSLDNGNAELLIEIIDTGIGIPEEQLADVFEKFSQVDQTGTRRHEGTGLGLSICQLLANRMSGSIFAESKLGQGSKFSFSLVLPVHEKPMSALELNTSLEGRTILLAGTPDFTEPAQIALTEYNCAVIAVPSLSLAPQALSEQTSNGSVDVIVLISVATPDLLDHDIAEFRKTAAHAEIPIIMAVTNGTPGDAKTASQAGVQAYLSCAFDAAAFLQMIRFVLQASSRPDAQGAPAQLSAPPLITRHSIAELAALKTDRPDNAPLGVERRYKVLIVDDSMVNQEIAKEFLEDLNCDVSLANNGQEAVSVTADQSFDLILMDCQMPVMDGFQATAAIRSRRTAPTSPQVPIIALTANAFASDREKCLTSGMSDFLSKPFLPNEFDSVVQKWLSTQAAAA